MSIVSSFCSHLKNNTAIGATLTAASDVYDGDAGQSHGARFIVVHEVPGGEHVHHQSGASGLQEAMIQASCWAESPVAARAISEALRVEMDGLDRTTLGTAPNNMTVTSVRLRNQVTAVDKAQTSRVSRTGAAVPAAYGVHTEWRVWAPESVPTLGA